MDISPGTKSALEDFGGIAYRVKGRCVIENPAERMRERDHELAKKGVHEHPNPRRLCHSINLVEFRVQPKLSSELIHFIRKRVTLLKP